MSLTVYNTLTKKKEPFVPLEPGKIKLYVCGVTVYDLCHVGHARSAIVFDVIYRHLSALGYDVFYVRNFTDIDDKIIKRANQEGSDYRTIADRYIAAFHEDMDRLGVLRPDAEPLATENIAEMIEIIRILLEKGIAYQEGDDVFFSVKRFPEYGKLSGRTLEDMVAGARVEIDDKKRNPMDFVLWKGSKPGEPAWDSPWGPGRPGWHIECSAMGKRFLGIPFDIHGGGKDLIFPHHENEIAQSEAAFGVPFVRYWLHNGFVNINNEKMSKSLGNFFTIREILDVVHPETLRLFVISKHYRSPVDFNDEALGEAGRALERIYGTLDQIEGRTACGGKEEPPHEKALRAQDEDLYQKLQSFHDEYMDAMNNDFNTAQAMGLLFDLQRKTQRFLDRFGKKMIKGPASWLARAAGETLREHGRLLGLLEREPRVFFHEIRRMRLKKTGLTETEVERLVAERNMARKAKDFQKADGIRDRLAALGIQLEDTPQGTRWRVR